jgi:hypothetical protein
MSDKGLTVTLATTPMLSVMIGEDPSNIGLPEVVEMISGHMIESIRSVSIGYKWQESKVNS